MARIRRLGLGAIVRLSLVTNPHDRDATYDGTMVFVPRSDQQTSRAAPRVLGPVVDDMTRCVHYRTEVDIVAIRFACCNEYYPCHRCHEETADHPAQQWKLSERDQEAVLCGACGTELTIASYLATTECPNCRSPFNERCRLHTHLYFQTSA